MYIILIICCLIQALYSALDFSNLYCDMLYFEAQYITILVLSFSCLFKNLKLKRVIKYVLIPFYLFKTIYCILFYLKIRIFCSEFYQYFWGVISIIILLIGLIVVLYDCKNKITS